ncbi:MAG TPA: ribosome maturation factor RimP [Elusimicrobiota bacterium]|jgi:ribosome maturation factor RimP|nr:ribosome maturation factor RimP [Elusimicrobiota bacterium]
MEAKEIETLIAPLVEQEGGEIVDLQWRREGHQWILRLFIDKPDGVTLDDCAYYSDRVGAFLDEKNAIEQSYVLEISSPGLDRVIKKDKDFEKFAGKHVKLRIKIAENGQRRFAGILKGLQEDKVAVQVGETLKTFDRRNVDEVRLDDSAAVDFGEK